MTSRQVIKYFSLLGGLLIIGGSLLPWLIVNEGTGLTQVNGLEGGDGVRTLITGASVMLATFVARGPRRFNSLVASFAGVLCGLIALRDLLDLAKSIELFHAVGGDAQPTMMIGAGLIFVLIGAALSIVGGLLFDPDKSKTVVKPTSISMR